MLNPPNNIKELRQFLGMVQYYQDMWARRSEMLAPLTDLVGECGETKTTRMNKIKKKPYEKADLPAIVRENCSHLIACLQQREATLSAAQIGAAF